MAYYVKKNGQLEKIAGNVSLAQSDWNETDSNKITKIKNRPDVIDNKYDLMAVEELGKLVDALAVKHALNSQNVSKYTGKIYNTLEEFVEETAKDISIPSIGRFADNSGFVMGNKVWYRYLITYQNPYQTGNTYHVEGNGLLWDENGRIFGIQIKGNKDAGLTATYKEINKPTINTKEDLIANTRAGLLPDALAVKDAINSQIKRKINTSGSIIMGEISGSGGSMSLQDCGITPEHTIEEIVKIITSHNNSWQFKRCMFFTPTDASMNLSSSLPVGTGMFVDFVTYGSNEKPRAFIEAYDYRTGNKYHKYILDGTASKWMCYTKYLPGDKITVNENIPYYGYCANAQVILYIPLPKNCNSAKVQNVTGTLKTCNLYDGQSILADVGSVLVEHTHALSPNIIQVIFQLNNSHGSNKAIFARFQNLEITI